MRSERIAIRHPKLPGEFVTVARRTLPAYERRGWVEAKSPAAKAAVEQETVPSGDPATPSEEDKS